MYGSDRMREEIAKMKYKLKTPQEWLEWIDTLALKCTVCNGSKIYRFGPNGKLSGPCFRCESKGVMTWEDGKRNACYDANRKGI